MAYYWGLWYFALMCGCRSLTDKVGNSLNSAKWQSLKFSKLKTWKFNKSGNLTKIGKLEIQQIRIYHKNSKTGILLSYTVRNLDVQERRNSGTQQCVLSCSSHASVV